MRQRVFLSLLLVSGLAGCTRTEAPPGAREPQWTKLEGGVHVLRAGDPCAINTGFVLTGKGVVVVDPGTAGDALARRLAAVTTEPVVAVFVTHRHEEQWRGGEALKARWPALVVYGHARTVAAGGAGIAVEDGDTLKAGALHFRVHALAPAHTDSDIAVEVVEAGTVFTGDAVYAGCVGPMEEASFAGAAAGAGRLRQLEARTWVPGRGTYGGREVMQMWHDYLVALAAHVTALRDQGKTEAELRPLVLERLAAWRQWAGFEQQAARHIGLAFREGAF